MACLQTWAEHRTACRAISYPIRSIAHQAHSVSSLPPRPAARRARQVSSTPAMALGAQKSMSSSGRKAESAPAHASGRKAKHLSSPVSASDPTFLGHHLCLHCAKFMKSTPEHHCLFDKVSSKMCACCRVLKNLCLPVSGPIPISF
jgi:hypothetical protein